MLFLSVLTDPILVYFKRFYKLVYKFTSIRLYEVLQGDPGMVVGVVMVVSEIMVVGVLMVVCIHGN